MFLITGQYDEYFITFYFFDCFYEVHRASLFNVCVLIKNLLVSRPKLKILFIYENWELILERKASVIVYLVYLLQWKLKMFWQWDAILISRR